MFGFYQYYLTRYIILSSAMYSSASMLANTETEKLKEKAKASLTV